MFEQFFRATDTVELRVPRFGGQVTTEVAG